MAWATGSGSSGQPGVSAVYPASSNTAAQRAQPRGSSQRPWTNTTGCRPVAFARLTCCASCSVIGAGSVGLVLDDSMVMVVLRWEWLAGRSLYGRRARVDRDRYDIRH